MRTTSYETPFQYSKGDVVRDVFTGLIYVVRRSYWQQYAGGQTADYTVELEPAHGQETPWNKSRNLVLVKLATEPPITD